MTNLPKCKRCGDDVRPHRRATNRRFCGQECYSAWWNEARSRNLTRSQIAERIIGTAGPEIQLSDVQSAWLAALLDGEGSIGLWRIRRTANKSGWVYRAGMEICNTNREILEAVRSVVGGWVNIGDVRKTNPRHKPAFKALLSQRAVLPVLRAVAPYLIIKRRQAEIVMLFRETLENAGARTASEHELFAQLWAECRELNRRGRKE